MLNIEELKSFGANTDEGIKRCAGKEDLYLKLVKTIPGNPAFEDLFFALEVGDAEAAFKAAHAIKGVISNLSLSPMTEKVAELTDLLRGGTMTGTETLSEDIKELRTKLTEICSS